MRFSELFQLNRTNEDDWFDPILSVDTKLFIDPFLLYEFGQKEFEGSHAEVIAFFNSVFQIIANSAGNPHTSQWQSAQNLLRFPEVEELCLGYTSKGTRGSGSGGGISRQIASALWKAVAAGVVELRHFEEVQRNRKLAAS